MQGGILGNREVVSSEEKITNASLVVQTQSQQKWGGDKLNSALTINPNSIPLDTVDKGSKKSTGKILALP